jgi:hypothetical protein
MCHGEQLVGVAAAVAPEEVRDGGAESNELEVHVRAADDHVAQWAPVRVDVVECGVTLQCDGGAPRRQASEQRRRLPPEALVLRLGSTTVSPSATTATVPSVVDTDDEASHPAPATVTRATTTKGARRLDRRRRLVQHIERV